MKLLLICAIVAMSCGVAVSQTTTTSMSHTPPADPLMERLGKDPAQYSRSVTGTILAVDSNRGSLTIQTDSGAKLQFTVNSKVRARADKDTALAGRKDLSLRDYTPGQFVRVSYRLEDNTALEVRLKHAKS